MKDSVRRNQVPQAESHRDDLGYVSAREISNVFMERLRQLDVEIFPRSGRTPGRDELIEFFSTLKIELMKRAGRNYDEYCRKNPLTRDPPKANPADELASAAAYAERKSRLSKYHGS